MSTKPYQLCALATFVIALSSCVSIPGTNKSVFLVTSPQEENKMGEDAYKDILKKEKESTDTRMKGILMRVGQRIAAVAEARHHVGYKWEFKLIESKEVNAFCLPGGKVAVYTGILKTMENEASMAIVIGHEVAHATLRHGGQRMSQSMAVQMGLSGAALASGFALKDERYRNLAIAALGAGATVGLVLPFSRSNESEADAYGLSYAAQAGYDPSEAANFWQRMSRVGGSGSKPPALLSTHPSDASRIAKLRELQSEVQPLYQKSPQYGLGEKF